MAYTIRNSRGEVVAVLQTGTENTSATSLTLLGGGFPSYGLQQNENFVYVLENFANSTAPSNPIIGQHWFNTGQNITYQRNVGNTWQALATQDYVQAQKISPVFSGAPQAPTPALGTDSNVIATTAFVANTLSNAGYAPVFSPNFTGYPTAPTPVTSNNSSAIATTEFVVNRINDPNLNPYATKASPALTGIPTAPTAANSTANTQIATTAFVVNYVNDPNLTQYAKKASPAFSGVPTAPTAANTTANTQIATTAFVSNLFNSIDLSPYATKDSPTLTGIPTAPTASAATSTNQLATTTFVQQQKISPEFTGIPLAPTASAGTNTTQIATTAFVQTAINSIDTSAASEMAGSIKMWGSATPPDGWALCNGQAVSRTTYATLFARIGTTFGSGNGSTTFNLPNYQDRFPVGAGNAYSAGSTGGYADAAVISHTHPVSTNSSITDNGHSHTVTANGVRHGYSGRNPGSNFYASDGDSAVGPIYPSMTSTVSTTGIGINVNVNLSAPNGAVSGTGRNIPPYIAGWWIIKLSDDGSGGGTLAAGGGIDITTGNGFSTITNTGVRSLAAGSGISITGSNGNLVVTNTGSLPIILPGQGINVVQSGSTFTITNTVTAPPVIGGNGISVTNTAGGAIVNAAVTGIVGGSGVSVTNNNGTYTINSSAPAGSITAWAHMNRVNGVLTLQGSFNINSVSLSSNYYYTFNFETPMTNSNYCVVASVFNTDSAVSPNGQVWVSSQSTSSFTVFSRIGSGLNVMVTGGF